MVGTVGPASKKSAGLLPPLEKLQKLAELAAVMRADSAPDLDETSRSWLIRRRLGVDVDKPKVDGEIKGVALVVRDGEDLIERAQCRLGLARSLDERRRSVKANAYKFHSITTSLIKEVGKGGELIDYVLV